VPPPPALPLPRLTPAGIEPRPKEREESHV